MHIIFTFIFDEIMTDYGKFDSCDCRNEGEEVWDGKRVVKSLINVKNNCTPIPATAGKGFPMNQLRGIKGGCKGYYPNETCTCRRKKESYEETFEEDYTPSDPELQRAHKNKQRADAEFQFARRKIALDKKYPKSVQTRNPQAKAQYKRELAALEASKKEEFVVKNIEEAVTMSTDKLIKWVLANVLAAILVIVLGFFLFYYWSRCRAYAKEYGPLSSDIIKAQKVIESSQAPKQQGASKNMTIREISRKNGGKGFVW